MTDTRAKEIIKDYKAGKVSLAEYVKAIEHCAIAHPDLTMDKLDEWVNENDYKAHIAMDDEEGLWI